ncbi:MAG: hypothetical protein KC435_03875 [Thermomicrobiales bacterium]|nr:hypothetical protein [Thermomicrobiales bacterium]
MRQADITESSRSRWRMHLSLFLIMVAAIAPMLAPTSLAAETLRGDEYTTDYGDHTITWTDDWSASLESDEDFSSMLMFQGDISIYAVMFIHDPDVGLSPRSVYYSLADVLLESFDASPTQTIEWTGDDGAFRGINLVEIEGIKFLLFMRVDPATAESGPTMQFAGAPVSAFPLSLEAMQQDLVINDMPVMDGEDGNEILAVLEENEPTSESAETVDSDSAAEPATAKNSADRNAPSSGLLPTSTEAESSGGEFESATNDYTVTYGDGWVATNSLIGEFSITSSGRPEVVISFTGRDTTETNRQAYFEDIVASEQRHSGYVNSVISDDRLLIASWSDDDELAVLEYIFVDDDTVVTVMVTVSGSKPEKRIEGVRTVEINGEPLLRDWDELWGE